MFTGRFFDATFGSSEKNSFPSTNILVTSLPLAVILPSESTSTPGNRFNKSSTTALGCVLYESALNSTVSSITLMGVLTAVTVVSASTCDDSDNLISPAFTFLSPTVTFL